MDYTKLNQLREFPFVKAFLAGKVTESAFHDDFNVFLKDEYFRNTFGFTEDNISLDELRTLENTLKFPQFTKVLKYNVILWRNLLLGSRLGCQVDILDFSTTRTGTHKYIKALAVLHSPKIERAKRLFVISAGNYAYALIYVMKEVGIEKELFIIVDKSMGYFARRKFKHKNVKIVTIDLKKTFIDLQKGILKKICPEEKIDDDLTKLRSLLYRNINLTDYYRLQFENIPFTTGAFDLPHTVLYGDIIQSLTDYDYIICPVGSGELIYSIWEEYFKLPTIPRKRIPKIIGIVPKDAHPLSLARRLYIEFGQKIKKTKTIALATPEFEMINLLETNIDFWAANDKNFEDANRLAKLAGINSEISGSAGLVFMDIRMRNENDIHIKSTDKILIVNTGNGKILP